jgi:hypothetical protein
LSLPFSAGVLLLIKKISLTITRTKGGFFIFIFIFILEKVNMFNVKEISTKAIEQGTVPMEVHPRFEALIHAVQQEGFCR